MDDSVVEVLRSDGVVYKAFVTDIFENEVQLAFENNQYPEAKFALDLVKLPPAKDYSTPKFTLNQEVEVLSKWSPSDNWGWRKALIKRDEADNVKVVKFVGYDYDFTVLEHAVEIDKIRHVNTNPPLDPKRFIKMEINVPENLREYAKLDGIHREFQTSIKACVCRYVPERGVQIVISTRSVMLLHSKVLKMYFANLQKVTKVVKRSERAIKNLHYEKLRRASQFKDEFHVPPELMKLARGFRNQNIRLARKLHGITSIEVVNNSCLFRIYGETEEAVKKARNMLQYDSVWADIPEYFAEKCIIDDILDKSGLASFTVLSSDKPRLMFFHSINSISVSLVGSVESLCKADVLIKRYMAELKATSSLERQGIADFPCPIVQNHFAAPSIDGSYHDLEELTRPPYRLFPYQKLEEGTSQSRLSPEEVKVEHDLEGSTRPPYRLFPYQKLEESTSQSRLSPEEVKVEIVAGSNDHDLEGSTRPPYRLFPNQKLEESTSQSRHPPEERQATNRLDLSEMLEDLPVPPPITRYSKHDPQGNFQVTRNYMKNIKKEIISTVKSDVNEAVWDLKKTLTLFMWRMVSEMKTEVRDMGSDLKKDLKEEMDEILDVLAEMHKVKAGDSVKNQETATSECRFRAKETQRHSSRESMEDWEIVDKVPADNGPKAHDTAGTSQLDNKRDSEQEVEPDHEKCCRNCGEPFDSECDDYSSEDDVEKYCRICDEPFDSEWDDNSSEDDVITLSKSTGEASKKRRYVSEWSDDSSSEDDIIVTKVESSAETIEEQPTKDIAEKSKPQLASPLTFKHRPQYDSESSDDSSSTDDSVSVVTKSDSVQVPLPSVAQTGDSSIALAGDLSSLRESEKQTMTTPTAKLEESNKALTGDLSRLRESEKQTVTTPTAKSEEESTGQTDAPEPSASTSQSQTTAENEIIKSLEESSGRTEAPKSCVSLSQPQTVEKNETGHEEKRESITVNSRSGGSCATSSVRPRESQKTDVPSADAGSSSSGNTLVGASPRNIESVKTQPNRIFFAFRNVFNSIPSSPKVTEGSVVEASRLVPNASAENAPPRAREDALHPNSVAGNDGPNNIHTVFSAPRENVSTQYEFLPDKMKEKLSLLNEMGFHDEKQNLALLRLYPNNFQRVIESLVMQNVD